MTVTKGEHRTFRPAHSFFQHDFQACSPEDLAFQTVSNRLLRLLLAFGNNHTFARCKSARLDHHIEGCRVHVSKSCLQIPRALEVGIRCRRNVVPLHEVLGESLRSFDLGSCCGRPENQDVLCSELVCDAVRQHLFWTHSNQSHIMFAAEIDDFREERGRDGDVDADHRHRVLGLRAMTGPDAAVARRHENAAHLRAKAHLPRQGVLSGTGA
mmetsp:Transcript_56825/g.91976  ORF Transcript_56825/g.91976 Transcript_56825/m.91976 type:complete len:212 (-) Transcript_56825:712-1347(-)